MATKHICNWFILTFSAHFLLVVAGGYNDDKLGFVGTRGTQFMVDGHPFYANGFNAYYLSFASVDPGSRPVISEFLQQTAAAGLNVARTWAFKDGGYRAFQISPGVYDESAIKALDFVINEAKRNGLRLILSLSDNYAAMGGKAKYVEWGRSAGLFMSSDDAFFTDPTIKGYYKNYIKAVLTRVNTITGVAYKDDPTIFAWELMNEARCSDDPSGRTLQAWIQEMAAYVKSIDSNHLLAVGLEGFYGPFSPRTQAANLLGSSLQVGTDFFNNHLVSGIDFATVHSYPDIWLPSSSLEDRLSFVRNWVNMHIEDGMILQKPVLFAEFGLSSEDSGFSVSDRDTFLSTIYETIYSSASSGGPAAGGLVWQLLPEALASKLGDSYKIVLTRDSSTARVIAEQSKKIAALISA